MSFTKTVGFWASTIAFAAIAFSAQAKETKKHPPTKSSSQFGQIEVTKLIVMPDRSGHSDFADAIGSAKKFVHMTMYHITDDTIVNALIAKAADKGVDVKVIVDGAGLKGGTQTVFNKMKKAGVNIRASSTAFSLTHSKDIVIDGKSVIIGAVNMTNTWSNSRDFAIVTTDQPIISEIETVFSADWTNAQKNGNVTPAVSNPNLAWAPTTADTVLVKLIDSATSTLVAETESFNHQDIIDALNRAAARGVNVRLIVPECDLGNATMNYPYLAQLKNVRVHVEHDGNSITQPYMHSKMMIVDNETMYIGSINYTFNSINKDRELGVVFTNATTSSELVKEFETDWNRSQNVPRTPNCGSSSGPTNGGGKYKKAGKGTSWDDEGSPWDVLTY